MGRHRINEGESRHGKHAPYVFSVVLYLTASEEGDFFPVAKRCAHTKRLMSSQLLGKKGDK